MGSSDSPQLPVLSSPGPSPIPLFNNAQTPQLGSSPSQPAWTSFLNFPSHLLSRCNPRCSSSFTPNSRTYTQNSPAPAIWQRRIGPSNYSRFIFAFLVFVSVGVLYMFTPFNISPPVVLSSSHPPHSVSWPILASEYNGKPACDPFSKPGYVLFNESEPSLTSWIPHSNSCPPAPDYLSALRRIKDVSMSDHDEDTLMSMLKAPTWRETWMKSSKSGDDGQTNRQARIDSFGRPHPDLTFLKGKTMLVLGDSVDRNFLMHLHATLGVNVRGHDYRNVASGIPQGWDHRGIPWSLRFGLKVVGDDAWDGGGWMEGMQHPNDPRAQFAGLNMEIVNGFFYGLDDRDEFSAQGDWHAPGLAETRINDLFVPLTNQIAQAHHHGEGPCFISLHSGLWDLAFFGRRNRALNETTSTPLTQAQMKWWIKRMRSVVTTLKKTFPKTPIWVRKIHRVGEQKSASYDWSVALKHGMGPGFVNFFTDIRAQQISQMQEHVAKLEGLPIFDFGKMWEGYQERQDKVHPFQDPSVELMGQAFFHHIWMESIGRHHWDEESQRDIGPLPHKT